MMFLLGLLTGLLIVAVVMLIVVKRGGVVVFTDKKAEVEEMDEVEE